MAAAQHLLRTQDRRCGRYAPITSYTGNSLMSGGPCDSIPAAAEQHYGTLIDTAHEAILRRLDKAADAKRVQGGDPNPGTVSGECAPGSPTPRGRPSRRDG
jgi:hypothetical protein